MTADDTDPIAAAATRYKRADDAAKKARETLTELVIDALREPGAKPADIARRADWTAAYVRKLARENGIQADPAYKARTEKARATLLAQAQAEQDDDSEIAAPAPAARKPAPATSHAAAVRRLTNQQAAELAQKAFRHVNETQHFDRLTDAANSGDRAVIQAALDMRLLDATDLRIA